MSALSGLHHIAARVRGWRHRRRAPRYRDRRRVRARVAYEIDAMSAALLDLYRPPPPPPASLTPDRRSAP